MSKLGANDRLSEARLRTRIMKTMASQKEATGKTNVAEVARLLRISRSTVYRTLGSQKMPSARINEQERQPDPIPLDQLDPKFQKMLEFTPEAFISFVEEFRIPGPRDIPGIPDHIREITKVMFGVDAVINIPPRHGKSEYFAVWLPIWLLTRNRNNQIILASKSHDQAMKHARRIGFLLERHERLINTFGRYRPMDPDKPWRSGKGELLIEGRSVLTESGDLSLQVRGSGAGILGMAANVIIADDVASPENSNHAAQRETLTEWFETELLSRLEPDGWVVVLGTRFHPQDIYGYLTAVSYEEEDVETGESKPVKVWKHKVFPAVTDWEAKTLLWPERFAWRFFMRRRAHNRASFESVYMQNPVPEGSILAPREWIFGDDEHPGCLDMERRVGVGVRTMAESPQGVVPISRVISIDPAPVNFTAMVVADVPFIAPMQPEKNFYACIIECVRDRMGPREMGKQVERMISTYGPIDYIVFENNSYNQWVTRDPVWEELRKVIRIISHQTGANKNHPEYGVMSMATDFEYGRIRIPYADAEARMQMDPFIKEATTYPGGETDDVMMATWFMKVQRNKLAPMVQPPKKQQDVERGFHVPKRLTKGYRHLQKARY